MSRSTCVRLSVWVGGCGCVCWVRMCMHIKMWLGRSQHGCIRVCDERLQQWRVCWRWKRRWGLSWWDSWCRRQCWCLVYIVERRDTEARIHEERDAYMYRYIHIHIHIHIYVYIYMYIYICIYIYIYTYIYVYVHIRIRIYTYTYTHNDMYTWMWKWTCIGGRETRGRGGRVHFVSHVCVHWKRYKRCGNGQRCWHPESVGCLSENCPISIFFKNNFFLHTLRQKNSKPYLY